MGGFSLGMHDAAPDSECVWAIDFDKAVAKTFKDNFGITCLGDIKTADTKDIPDHDVLFGGFPCQPFSQTGKWRTQVGDSEERDNLFLELVRILRAKQPRYFVFENVENLLRMKNKDGSSVLTTILFHLDDAGYDVEYAVLNAKDYGVPQSRERVFFVGTRKDLDIKFEFPAPTTVGVPAIEDILDSPPVPDKYLLKNEWAKLIIRSGVADGGIKPNHDFTTGQSRYEAVQSIYDANPDKPTARTGETTAAAILYGDTPSGKARRTDKVYSSLGISPTVIAFSGPAIDSPQGLRSLTPRECARLQGFPDTYKLASRDQVAYKQVGNAVCVKVVAAVVTALLSANKTRSTIPAAPVASVTVAPVALAPAPKKPRKQAVKTATSQTLESVEAAKVALKAQFARELAKLEAEEVRILDEQSIKLLAQGDNVTVSRAGMTLTLPLSDVPLLVKKLREALPKVASAKA